MRSFYRIEQIPTERRPQCLNIQRLDWTFTFEHCTLNMDHLDIGKRTLNIEHWKLDIEQFPAEGRS